MTFLSLFSGIGGLDLGLERAGMKCIAQVEIDPFCRRVLAKHWPDVPKFEDVREFNRESISAVPDLICGGFPCQDISAAGKRVGIDGERSGLWRDFYRIISEIRPRYALVENVPALLGRGMGRVIGDLASIGYDAEWSVVSACAMGAPHSRERVFCVAYPNEVRHRSRFNPDESPPRFDHWKATEGKEQWGDVELWLRETFQAGDRKVDDATITRIPDGVPTELDDAASDAYGNAVVPQVAEWIGRRIIEAAQTREAVPA